MKKWLILMVTVALVAAVFTGCAAPQGQMPEIVEVTRGDLSIDIAVNGNLEMPHKTDLSFGTTGMVEEVLVDEGDSVVEGQILARLDSRALELNVASARVAYESAQINLMQTIYPAYTKTWGTDLPGVWLALAAAQENMEKAKALINEGEIEEAYVVLGLVEENLKQAEKKSLSSQWDLPWNVKLLELQVDGAEANLEAAMLNLEKAMIIAPFDGTIAAVTITEGKELSAMSYANPAISLIDTSDIEMDGFIDEIDISMVKVGQEADIILDALPDKEVKGTVSFISQIGTVQVGIVSYKTTITLENPDEELRDGMSATAEIILTSRDNVLLIPNKAIRGSLTTPVVVVAKVEQIRSEEDVETRPVTLGLSNGIYTEVLSGLVEGEIILLPLPNKTQPFGPFGE